MKPRKLISPPALNDPRTRQDLETLLRMIREGLCGMDDVRSLHDMMNMLHTKQDGEEVFRFTMNWLAAPFQQPGLNLGTNLWQLGPLCPSRSLALASRMALRKCPRGPRTAAYQPPTGAHPDRAGMGVVVLLAIAVQ